MGAVYEALRESLKNHVALKVMHSQYRNRANYLRRFHTEARSAARLHHTNIVSVFDYGEHDGVCYYAMQYIAGQSLDKVIDDIRELRLEQAGRPTGDTITLSRHTESRATPDDIPWENLAQGVVRSGKQTVTLGLLTGRFAAADGDLGPDQPNTPLSADRNGGPSVTRYFGSDPGQAESPMSLPLEPTASASVHDPDTTTRPETTSSLTGKIDIRYYREIARLGAQVADALAYAHKRGVLHRDIKPPNLILDPLGNVWVTDFGLAKFEEGEDLSQSQDLVGTLRYMAPERFRGVSDRRGDVYALGATLYQLLTLRAAFEGTDQLQLIQKIENEPPVPLRQLDPRIPRDLETIVHKTLAKDPNDRFPGADELADELRRFIENRPIRSRPLPYYQQFWRWCKRNPWLATANITAAALTTILAVVSTVAAFIYREKNRQVVRYNQKIERSQNETREQLFGALQAQARAGRYSRRMGQRFSGLDALAEAAAIARDLKLPPKRFDLLRDEAIPCLALPDLKPTGRVITMPVGVVATAFDSAMSRYALRFRDGTVQVRRVDNDDEITRFSAQGDRDIFIFEFSPDGRYLATTHAPRHALTVWEVNRGAVVLNDPEPVPSNSVEFSPDSRRVAVGHVDGEVIVYDLPSARPGMRQKLSASHRDLVFRSDGTELAILSDEAERSICRIIDAHSGRLIRPILLPPTRFESIAWSPDGSALAMPCSDSKIYVWDAATSARKAVLEGHTNAALRTSFDASGALLASNGWEGRLRIWDAASGRQWLNVTGYGFILRRDGTVVVQTENKLTPYQVDPALEYRTLVHAASSPLGYYRVSVHRGGRLLALATNGGVVLWDLARGTELAFLPIGLAWHSTFEPSGDLLTNGPIGVWRWPVRVGGDRSEYQIGPPQRVPLAGSTCEIDQDRSGRIIALADHSQARVLTPDRRFSVGPLEDCRGVAVSSDGKWLATGTHASRGVQIWRIEDGTKVKDLPIDYATGVFFSPDGKWLVTNVSPSRLWSVGTWEQAREIGGHAHCFSPNGDLLVVQDRDMTIRLVETDTGRTLARLESPDLCALAAACFTPDGTRLVVSTNDGPAVHIWDLRAIRKHLVGMGLDWDAPAYADDNSAGPSALALPAVRVDYGRLSALINEQKSHAEQNAIPAEDVVANCTDGLKARPNDPELLHRRGHGFLRLKRLDQALADFSAASAMRPLDAHLLATRGICLFNLSRYAPALDRFESAYQIDPESLRVIVGVDQILNDLAWKLATSPRAQRDPVLAVPLASFAVTLAPGQQVSLNTLGVALYRAGRYTEAVTTFEKSLDAGQNQFDAFDLFFLAMAHQRRGGHTQARVCFERAVDWVRGQKNLTQQQTDELAGFRTEAEAVLTDRLPVNVFAPD